MDIATSRYATHISTAEASSSTRSRGRQQHDARLHELRTDRIMSDWMLGSTLAAVNYIQQRDSQSADGPNSWRGSTNSTH